jgi:hypothetical protein
MRRGKTHWTFFQTDQVITTDERVEAPWTPLWEDFSAWEQKLDFCLSLGFSGIIVIASQKTREVGEGQEKEEILTEALAIAKKKGIEIALSLELKNPSLLFSDPCSFPFWSKILTAVYWKSVSFRKDYFSEKERASLTFEERWEKEWKHLLVLFPSHTLLYDLTILPTDKLPWIYKAIECLPQQFSCVLAPYNEQGVVHPYLRQKPFDEKNFTKLLFSLDSQLIFPPLFSLLFLAKMENLFVSAGAFAEASFLFPSNSVKAPLAEAVQRGINESYTRAIPLRAAVAAALRKEGVVLAEWESFPGFSLLLSALPLCEMLVASFPKSYEEKKEQFALCFMLLDSAETFWKRENVQEWVSAIQEVRAQLEEAAQRESITVQTSSQTRKLFAFH